MHWLYRFFWLRTTFRAACKSPFLAWLLLSLRRGKLGHVSAPRNTGSGSPLRPWAPTFSRLSLTPLPPFPPEHKSQHRDAHVLLTGHLPAVSLDCHLGKGRNWLSVLCVPRAGVGPGSPPAPGRGTGGPCGGTDSFLWNAPVSPRAVCARRHAWDCLAHRRRVVNGS